MLIHRPHRSKSRSASAGGGALSARSERRLQPIAVGRCPILGNHAISGVPSCHHMVIVLPLITTEFKGLDRIMVKEATTRTRKQRPPVNKDGSMRRKPGKKPSPG